MIRLMKKIKECEKWKKHDWTFAGLFFLALLTSVLNLMKPDALVVVILTIITGLLLLFALFHVTKPYFSKIWESGAGKIVITFFSLLVVAVARSCADHQIVTVTGAPASLLPMAQDILTLLFSIIAWYFLIVIILWFLMLLSLFIFLLFDLVEDFDIKSGKTRSKTAFKFSFCVATLAVILTVNSDKILRMKSTITEQTIIWSSFVLNDKLCPLQPNYARVALVKDDAVMVALPAMSKETPSAFTYLWGPFTYLWGKCGNESPR